jgi:hypothetical protein
MKIDGRTPARSSSWAKPIAAALTLVLLSGCAVGPNYQRPEATPIPETYAGPAGEWKIAGW